MAAEAQGAGTEAQEEKEAETEAQEDTDSNSKDIASNYGRPWTEAEHEALYKGLKNHKWNEWDDIAVYVKTRTTSQVYAKCTKFTSYPAKKNEAQIMKDLRISIQQVRLLKAPFDI